MLSYRKVIVMLTGMCLFIGTRGFAQSRTVSSGASCSITQNGKALSWKRVSNIAGLKLPVANGKAKLPLKYAVYTTDAAGLRAFLVMAQGRGQTPTEIVLPVSAENGCLRFSMTASGTMSAELAAKYPQLVSLKGTGTEDKSASLRLDYDGKDMNAEILWGGTYYIIAPWKKGSHTYYLVYRKEDSVMKRSTPYTGNR